MAEPVSLRNVADELEALMEGMTAYLNRLTGELYTLSNEDVRLLDEESHEDDLPEWQRDMLAKIREVLESEDWLRLPSKFDIHEWAIMDAFARSIEAPDLRDDLLGAIRGKGAFRSFKDTLYRWGIQDRWYRYKTAALEQIAARWLDEHAIAYRLEESPASARKAPN